MMKSYSFIRETAPAVMKNTPKEGTVLKGTLVKCVYSSGSTIAHTDTFRQGRQMINSKLSRVTTR